MSKLPFELQHDPGFQAASDSGYPELVERMKHVFRQHRYTRRPLASIWSDHLTELELHQMMWSGLMRRVSYKAPLDKYGNPIPQASTQPTISITLTSRL
jgi:hypothetical protein